MCSHSEGEGGATIDILKLLALTMWGCIAANADTRERGLLIVFLEGGNLRQTGFGDWQYLNPQTTCLLTVSGTSAG